MLGQPLVHGPKARGLEAVQPAAPFRPAPDEPDLAEDPEVLRDLRLGHRQVAHDRPDRLLACDQLVEDVSAMGLGEGVEDVGGRRGTSHVLNICRYRNMSSTLFVLRRALDRRYPALAPLHPDLIA